MAPLEAPWRTVSPNARLYALWRPLCFHIAFPCYTLGKLGPALTEEGFGDVVVADLANGFGRACGLPEVAAEGLALHQRARGHKGTLATRPAGTLRRRADAVATDQYRAVEVEIVPIRADRAAGVDSRPLERDRVLLEPISRHAQALGANDFAGRDIAGGGAAFSCATPGSAAPTHRPAASVTAASSRSVCRFQTRLMRGGLWPSGGPSAAPWTARAWRLQDAVKAAPRSAAGCAGRRLERTAYGDGLSPLAIRRFDRAEIFAFATDDDA